MKPIVFFDLETTGVDPVKDRIVSISAKRITDLITFDVTGSIDYIVNPGIPIPKEASDIHGITDEMVKNAPHFEDIFNDVVQFFCDCDLAGFNITNFDVVILWEELHREGFDWDLTGVNQIDACTIFKKMEQRTLAAAVKFYIGLEHKEAHNAEGDVNATIQVLRAQLARYKELSTMDPTQLGQFSMQEPRFDLAGKLTIDKDGEPVYAFGKSKGVKVKNDPGFGRWMLRNDFPTQTKLVLTNYLRNECGGAL